MRPASELPSAAERPELVMERIEGRRPAVFLDYDGTLTPIVRHPDEAVLSEEMREAVERLSRVCRVAVVSGRDLADVRERVGLDHLVYAGSHGMDIAGPDGLKLQHPEALELLPALDHAQDMLHLRLVAVPGSLVERKRFAVSVHYREVAEDKVEVVERVVNEVLSNHPDLRRSEGKKVLELRPDIEWDKGRAVRWLLEALDLDRPEVLPVYVGDDVTDEDAFAALAEDGLGIVVRDEPRDTRAHLAVDDTGQVRRLLEALRERLE